MTYTAEDIRLAVLTAVCLGIVIGACVSVVWLAIIQEARATQRIPDLSQAASIVGKHGRAKQMAAYAAKRNAMTERLQTEVRHDWKGR